MDKTVLVTGAASGIGLASAKLLLEDGCRIRAFDPQGGPNDDVPDPYYGGDEGFETVFTIVTRTCEAILEQIRHGAPFIEE